MGADPLRDLQSRKRRLEGIREILQQGPIVEPDHDPLTPFRYLLQAHVGAGGQGGE